jgi:hypothetical protein
MIGMNSYCDQQLKAMLNVLYTFITILVPRLSADVLVYNEYQFIRGKV